MSPHRRSLAPGSLPVEGEPVLPSPPTQDLHTLEIGAPGRQQLGWLGLALLPKPAPAGTGWFLPPTQAGRLV